MKNPAESYKFRFSRALITPLKWANGNYTSDSVKLPHLPVIRISNLAEFKIIGTQRINSESSSLEAMFAKPKPTSAFWILDRVPYISNTTQWNIAFTTSYQVVLDWTLIKPLIDHSIILLGQLLWVMPYMVGSLNLMIMYPLLKLFQYERGLKQYYIRSHFSKSGIL